MPISLVIHCQRFLQCTASDREILNSSRVKELGFGGIELIVRSACRI